MQRLISALVVSPILQRMGLGFSVDASCMVQVWDFERFVCGFRAVFCVNLCPIHFVLTQA